MKKTKTKIIRNFIVFDFCIFSMYRKININLYDTVLYMFCKVKLFYLRLEYHPRPHPLLDLDPQRDHPLYPPPDLDHHLDDHFSFALLTSDLPPFLILSNDLKIISAAANGTVTNEKSSIKRMSLISLFFIHDTSMICSVSLRTSYHFALHSATNNLLTHAVSTDTVSTFL